METAKAAPCLARAQQAWQAAVEQALNFCKGISSAQAMAKTQPGCQSHAVFFNSHLHLLGKANPRQRGATPPPTESTWQLQIPIETLMEAGPE